MCFKNTETGTRFGSVALLVVFHGFEEDIKQADQVCGAGLVLWVELNTGKTHHNGFNHIVYSQTICPTKFQHFWFVSSHHSVSPSPVT